MSFSSLTFLKLVHRVRQYLRVWMNIETSTTFPFIVVATGGTPAMVGRHRGFSFLIKEYVPIVHTACCVIHWQHHAAIKQSGELHEALKVCITSINRIKAHPFKFRLLAKIRKKNY